MRERRKFSKEFKDKVVQKILSRGGLSVREICDREGVGLSTAANWVKACGTVTATRPAGPRGRMKWTAEAKLKAVIETANLNETDLGIYLRKVGLFSNQLAEWRSEIIENLSLKPKFKKDERDDQIKVLEREILRKDKALAEASALLILEKKVALIWGGKKEDEK